MSDRAPWEQEPAPPPPQPTAAEKAEAAAIRRRWLTLGELLAVIAVAISGLTLWNSYRERSNAEADRAAAESKAAKVSATLVLKATLSSNRETLTLAPADGAQTIQSQHLLFPTATGIAPVDTIGDARIEAGWLAKAIKAADPPHGRELRLGLAITSRFLDAEGEQVETTALYHVGYRVEARLIGTAVELSGLSLIGKVAPAKAQARLDALGR